MQVLDRRAPNGVEDDVTMLWRCPESTATLGGSFRCKLRNWAHVIGEEGYIAIPDFWRANEAMHYRLDECVGHFRDERESLGFDYEIRAFMEDISVGRRESEVVPLANLAWISRAVAPGGGVGKTKVRPARRRSDLRMRARPWDFLGFGLRTGEGACDSAAMAILGPFPTVRGQTSVDPRLAAAHRYDADPLDPGPVVFKGLNGSWAGGPMRGRKCMVKVPVGIGRR